MSRGRNGAVARREVCARHTGRADVSGQDRRLAGFASYSAGDVPTLHPRVGDHDTQCESAAHRPAGPPDPDESELWMSPIAAVIEQAELADRVAQSCRAIISSAAFATRLNPKQSASSTDCMAISLVMVNASANSVTYPRTVTRGRIPLR